MMPHVPTITAIENIHKNKRSNTIATYFQSSLTWNFFFSNALVNTFFFQSNNFFKERLRIKQEKL